MGQQGNSLARYPTCQVFQLIHLKSVAVFNLTYKGKIHLLFLKHYRLYIRDLLKILNAYSYHIKFPQTSPKSTILSLSPCEESESQNWNQITTPRQ